MTTQLIIGEALAKKGIYAFISPWQTQVRRNVWQPHVQSIVEDGFKLLDSQMTIETHNGSLIYFLGRDNVEAIRGLHLNGAVIDECCDMTSNFYYNVFLPTLKAKNGWSILIGTPKAEMLEGLFNNFEGFKSIYPASTSGRFSEEELSKLKHTYELAGKNNVYEQEYECSFDSGAEIFFKNYEQVCANNVQDANSSSSYVMGLDVASKTDFMVASIFEKYTNKMVKLDRFQLDYSVAQYRVEALAREYSAPILLDSTGPGNPFSSMLKSRGLLVEDFVYNTKSKEEIMTKLNIFINQKYLTLLNDEELKSEFKRFKSRPTKFGLEFISSGHDDIINSIALAVWKLEPPSQNTELSNYSWLQYNLSNNKI